jgi:hypothetical protein
LSDRPAKPPRGTHVRGSPRSGADSAGRSWLRRTLVPLTDLYEVPPCITCRVWVGPGFYAYDSAPGWCPLHELRTWASGGCRRHTASLPQTENDHAAPLV